MLKLGFLAISLSIFKPDFGQVKVELRNQGMPIALNQWNAQPNGDSIYLSEFKFYLVLPSDTLVLVDAAEQTTLWLPYVSCDDEIVLLQIGMDSAMNTCGRLDGPYDPLLGMYWAWNTGYTQLKCKGTMRKKGKDFSFEYHLGGYRSPYFTSVQKWVRMIRHTWFVNLDTFLSNLPVDSQPKIMLPGATAHQLFLKFTEGFQ